MTTQATIKLQNVILRQACSYVAMPPYYDTTEFTASLEAVTKAVESAYILTAKDDLPKVTAAPDGYFAVEGFGSLRAAGGTSAYARKRAAAWLAVTRHLEAEEDAKAAEESKAKVEAMWAADAAKRERLNELADEWFGKPFADLGPNKAAAVNEIYRLETKLNAKDAA